MDGSEAIRHDVIRVCRVLDGMGLVEGFGHVSARLPDGNVLITPARGLRLAEESALLVFNLGGDLVSGEGIPAPLERWMHLAVYRARPDVGAICRTHSRYAVALGAAGTPIQAAHGFGGMLGLRIPVHPESDLIADDALGRAVAATLGEGAAALLRGNGALVVGSTLKQACVRAIYLEEAAFVQVAAAGVGGAIPFTAEELARRARWYEVEVDRAWEYYTARFAP
jgi:ribulose-5-phosphate 4-epimerase/fuculose-1-phosphate aldolase